LIKEVTINQSMGITEHQKKESFQQVTAEEGNHWLFGQ
jgi:hypothetical protein